MWQSMMLLAPASHPVIDAGLYLAVVASILWLALFIWRFTHRPAFVWSGAWLAATGTTAVFAVWIGLFHSAADVNRSYDPVAHSVKVVYTALGGTPGGCIETQGVPLGLQFSVLAIGIIVMQGVVVQFDMLDGVMVSSSAQMGFGAANKLSNLTATPMNALGTAMTSFTAQNLGAGNHDRIRRGALQALGMMAIIAVAAVSCGLLLTLNNTYLHIFLSADKITADTIRFGNTFLYVDYSMYLFLGCVFITRNCVQGIGRSQFVLGAGAAELVARIAVCLVLPAAVAGGAVSAAASPAAFYALCAADPLAWIAADIIMGTPVVRNILRKDYRYMNL